MSIDDLNIDEASIGQMLTALRAGSLTSAKLVEMYLSQIAQCDQSGPRLNAVVTINPSALDEAHARDQRFRDSGTLTGPLHGIPIVVKDCLETGDMPTSFGSEVFADYVASEDATVIAKLKNAGAIILAKTTLPDWATSWFAYSSRSGETKNPYDLARDPGGSSSGTGAAVAAGYAPIGLGTDCGGSVRLPSSFCNLVGVRSTPGLISRHGCNPLVGLQDTIGPMGRSVEDAARVFDVMVGYDPKDSLSAAYTVARAPVSYLSSLVPDALVGQRLGVVRNAFGDPGDPRATAVTEVIDHAIDALAAGGATMVDVEVPDLGDWLVDTSLYLLKSKYDINRFLAARDNAPAKSVGEIVDAGHYHKMLDLLEQIADGPDDPLSDLAYYQAYHAREEFMRMVVGIMSGHELSALVYPTSQVVPPTRAETDSGDWTTLTFPTNTLIGSQTWMSAMSVPAGFTDGGLPVGLEILARPYDEATMFRIAYGFEQTGSYRRRPAAVPRLTI